ncbi:PD-(D/E)XK nuclease family protein [Allobranchiibius sp. GilTou73]|uniref:PD-(D/E)XK nuclease family protein n=1 Tax=Allobranchiibius sp. GilTou73 TaxID=2904523 RepID=UPI001F3CFA62|nr:PD-(D/E)XK nuclease family protein [Allobranchiibius sp. GilTou73]UIJ35075.1 PD-(D/E)XK nuclease family protein [Allobranchiibius sp. GilTou73]
MAGHPATTRALLNARRALRDVDATTLDEIAEANALTADVVRLHRGAVERLGANWYDEADLLLEACSQPLPETGSVVFYLPQDLTRAENAFAERLVAESDAHVILGATGDTRPDRGPTAAASFLSGELPADAVAPAQPRATRVLHASDADDEVRAVVREVVASLSTTAAHRVGILYSRRVPYARLLNEQLVSAGVRFNGPGARPVEERAVPRLLLGLMRARAGGYRRGDVMGALGEAPARDLTGGRISVSRWERISRGIGIVDDTDWDERLDAFVAERRAASADVAESDLAWRERDAQDAEHLRDTVRAVRETFDKVDCSTSWADAAVLLTGLLDRMVPDGESNRLPLEEQYAAVATRRALAGVADLDLTDLSPSMVLVEEIVQQQLEAGSERVGRFGDGVFVGPVADAIGLDLDVVFVVGLSEDQCPGRVMEDPLLPERVRVRTGGQLPGIRETIERQHRHVLAAFQCAPTVVATFPRGDLRRQTNRIPSRWLLPTLRQLSGDPTLTATAFATAGGIESIPSFAAGLLSTSHPATEQEWRTRAVAAHTPFDDPTMTAARELQQGRSGETPTRFDGLVGTTPALPAVTGANAIVSPTALESFAACPHAYFVQRILGVRPVEEPEDVFEVSPAEVGTFIHHCFDSLITEAAREHTLPGYGEPWTAQQRARLQVVAGEEGQRLVASGRAGHPIMWERRLVEIRRQLDDMLTDDERWRVEQGARIVGSEVRFGFDDAPAVELLLGDGSVARMRGSADLVMETETGTLIVVDIKTGSPTKFKDISTTNPVVGGTKLQLPAYAHAVRAQYGDASSKVEALYWFHSPRARKRIELELTDDVRVQYVNAVERLTTAISSGIFPPRAPEKDDYLWVQCPNCNPDGLGHSDVRERWETIKTAPQLRELVTLIEPGAVVSGGSQHD